MKTKSIVNWAAVKMGSDGTFSALASTETIDRDGEVVLASAFSEELDTYRANPVIMAAHTHRSLDGYPTVIGSATKIEVTEGGLAFDGRFAGTDLGKTYRTLYEEGHMKAFSVGFIPIDGEMRELRCGGGRRRRRDLDDAEQTRPVYVHTRVELLEISCVAVPANPEATVRGFDPEELERLIDQRISKVLKDIYTQRLLSLLDGK